LTIRGIGFHRSLSEVKNVLISGGAGFIGCNLAVALASRKYRVTVLDNFSAQIHGDSTVIFPAELEIQILKGDVRSREDWLRSLVNQDVVVHFAAETGTGQSMYRIERYMGVNVLGTANLLELLANEPHSVKKILVASSRAIYGEGKYHCDEHGSIYPSSRAEADMLSGDFAVKCPACKRDVALLPTDEGSRIHPSSVYGISKQTQEQLFMTVAQSLRIPSVALRYQNVYGPGQSLLNPYTGILSIFSTRIRNGAPLSIFEDGNESRDFIYIDDVVEATRMAIESDAADYEVFNVGTGTRTDVLSVARRLCSALGGRSAIEVSGKFRVGDIRHNFADVSKIQARLGFFPKVQFEEGIRRFAAWVTAQPVPADRFDDSIEELRRRGLYK
jgi:dTDP-L-rhamnose 4-epimerase